MNLPNDFHEDEKVLTQSEFPDHKSAVFDRYLFSIAAVLMQFCAIQTKPAP
jgi:hypothetical protein